MPFCPGFSDQAVCLGGGLAEVPCHFLPYVCCFPPPQIKVPAPCRSFQQRRGINNSLQARLGCLLLEVNKGLLRFKIKNQKILGWGAAKDSEPGIVSPEPSVQFFNRVPRGGLPFGDPGRPRSIDLSREQGQTCPVQH